MKKSNADMEAMQEALQFVNKLKEKRELVERKNMIKKICLVVRKVYLYTFKSEMPTYVDDDKFADLFKYYRCIYATILDESHVKEVKTGRIFPILDLQKEDDRFKSSLVARGCILREAEYSKGFVFSENGLLECESLSGKKDLDDLSKYLSLPENVIDSYINGEYYQSEEKVKQLKI